MRLKNEIREKRLQMKKKKVLFHQDNAPCHKSLATMAKLNELSFKLLPHPPYSPDLAPSDYYLFADLKKMLQGKRFYSNEEVITETNAYFEAKDKSFYKKCIEVLEKRWTDCVAFEGDYVSEYSRVLPKKCVFPSQSQDLLIHVLRSQRRNLTIITITKLRFSLLYYSYFNYFIQLLRLFNEQGTLSLFISFCTYLSKVKTYICIPRITTVFNHQFRRHFLVNYTILVNFPSLCFFTLSW